MRQETEGNVRLVDLQLVASLVLHPLEHLHLVDLQAVASRVNHPLGHLLCAGAKECCLKDWLEHSSTSFELVPDRRHVCFQLRSARRSCGARRYCTVHGL